MAFSLNDKHIVVKYHYIANPREDRRAFYPCPIDEFERQVSFLKNNFKITTVEEVFKAAQNKSGEKMCALTFDDGLKDHYQNALPVLKKHTVKGTFFPITKTFEGFLPATHKMHIALSRKDADGLVDYFNNFLNSAFPQLVDGFVISKTERLTKKRKIYDDIPTANLKETMNIIPRDIRNAFLDNIFKELALNEKKLSGEIFVSPEEIKELYTEGHIIGNHAHSHGVLDTMEKLRVEEEFTVSQKILTGILGNPPTILAYPQSAPSKSVREGTT
ncbi:MAG: polysaccharide deacetylase family protein [Parcubacteria group bacterium]|nr:polysaccharide deacetylase family protein [Parcubacteria group bacterium]